MAAIPSLEEVYSWVPAENQLKLDLPIDFRDLSQIADHLLEWDGSVAVELQLGKIDVHDIIVEHRSEPRQQRRLALVRWQERYGSSATYRNLIIALHSAQKMDYVEVVCSQLGGTCLPTKATPTTPGLRIPSGSDLRSLALASDVMSAASNSSVLSFTDCLTPQELTTWLSQELESKGLNLEQSQRQSLIDEHINGEAFRKLTDGDLKELGFKLGARKNIQGIISSLSVSSATPSSSLSPTSNRSARDASLTVPALVDALESLVYWYTFGLRLDLPSHKLDVIQHECHGVKNQKVALYKLWLEMDEQASWSKVCDALWQEGKRVLATQLRTKYVNKRQAQTNNRGSKVMKTALLEYLTGLSNEDVKSVGVAMGVANTRLEGASEGQSAAEILTSRYNDSYQMSWSELETLLEKAGLTELAKRAAMFRNNIEKPSRYSDSNET